ncbi:MAG TPA: carbon-nitrogen hydrolase family protein [Solirubrobacterales bacterium]|nr:carbon-nitrogen hydrolase family protein [Solirubrobacterales bacterium]
MRAAAIQLEAKLADVEENLAMCERLAAEAAEGGAELIVLPEFFSSAIGFAPELASAVRPIDGAPAELLRDLAVRHRALVGGSFLARDEDGEVRNAFLLYEPDGSLAGRHDKDMPTMWENSFYVGGNDDGVITTSSGLRLGVALCWELMRTQTPRRLAGRVDIVVGGSGWWSQPANWPGPLVGGAERRNRALARRAAAEFPLYVGVPLVHASHAGSLRCGMPGAIGGYVGHFEGAAMVVERDGRVLAERDWSDGEGVLVAEVEPGAAEPARQLPDRFWLHDRGYLATCAWNVQRLHGRRWYRRNVAAA